MNLKIYLFRHGQTYFNRDKRFTGWKDSKLTPRGVMDAKKIAKMLKNKKIDVAFCSKLSRSRNTLMEILKYHPECRKVITDNRMIERSYGKFQGMSHDAFIKRYGKKMFDKYHRAYDFPPPKGESIKMVEKRVNSFIKDLLFMMKSQKVNVAVSAHGNSMRPFRKHFEKLTLKKMLELENPWDNYFEYTVKA